MELHALAQMEPVGLAIQGNLPAMRQIRDNRLGAIVGIEPDQIVDMQAAAPRTRMVPVW